MTLNGTDGMCKENSEFGKDSGELSFFKKERWHQDVGGATMSYRTASLTRDGYNGILAAFISLECSHIYVCPYHV